MSKNYFETVCEIISSNEKTKNFEFNKNGEYSVTFRKDDKCYEVEYDDQKNLICIFSVDGASEGKKMISSWLMEFDKCTSKDVNMIANDFIQTMAGDTVKKGNQSKTRKNSENHDSVTSLFFANRMASVFPKLKDKIQEEKNHNNDIKIATFTQENILPCVKEFLATEQNKSRINKFGKTLSDLYHTGSLDVRSVITMGILCGLDEKTKESGYLRSALSEELAKAWKASLKYKGKKVRPEKLKTKKSFMAKLLEAQNNMDR